MGKNTEEFKQWLTKELKDLRPERKETVVKGLIQAFIQALGDAGIEIEVHQKVNEEFPSEMEDFIDMLKASVPPKILEIMEKAEKVENNMDRDDKVLGDNVQIIDRFAGAYMHDFDTKVQLSKDFDVPNKSFAGINAVVIDTNAEFEFNCGHCDETHRSDLVIYFPSTEKKYHIASKLVKLV